MRFDPVLTRHFSDWIALNVLRSVALSTNSVAASVEPVMQQQFFTLSPMVGQESFGSTHTMAQTPTTSSMLAALQHDTFGAGPLDPTSSAFGTDAFASLSYMDTSPSQDDSMPVHSSGLSFPDYVSGSGAFDVGAFTPQDLGLSTTETPPPSTGSEPDESDIVKTES